MYGDVGASLTGLIAARPKDVIGLAIAVAGLSPMTPAIPGPIASPPPEMAIEASYQANFGKGFSLQPNAQLILNPYNANTATSQRRAIVIGLRTAFRL